MTSPLDPQRILHQCMQTIQGADKAMTDDIHDAAMKLGAAGMMLASVSHAVSKHAADLLQAPAPQDTRGI